MSYMIVDVRCSICRIELKAVYRSSLTNFPNFFHARFLRHHFHRSQYLLIYHNTTSPLQFCDDICDIRFLHETALFRDRADDQKSIDETCKVAFRDVLRFLQNNASPRSMNHFLHYHLIDFFHIDHFPECLRCTFCFRSNEYS